MNTEKRLSEIWNEDYINSLPSLVKDRGYMFADNVQKDILITGFNPSYREGEPTGVFHGPISEIWYKEKYDNYWGPIKKMINDENVDLRERTDYLDIFYFREQEQRFLNDKILGSPNGIRFVVDQLNLTMHIIEEIVKPKLLIIKNKESWAYFGKLFNEKGWVWMGYQFEHIQDMACGELCRIKGLLNSEKRIAPEIQQTNLIGSFVLFTKHINQYTAVNERPTPQLFKSILDWYESESIVRRLSV
jgi:hypothetical protein